MSLEKRTPAAGIRRLERSPGLRERVRKGLDRYLGLPLGLASVLMILLTIVQLTAQLRPQDSAMVTTAIFVLWGIFLLHLLLQFVLAPHKGRFLRREWLRVIATAIPFFSVFRIAALIRLAPMVRLLLFGGRHMSTTMRILRRRHLAQLAMVTVFVVLIATVLEYAVESDTPGANINSMSEALWWAAATITTMGGQLYPVTEAGRILGFLLMLYAVGGFSYLMASLAAVLVGSDTSKKEEAAQRKNLITIQISSEELGTLRRLLEAAEASTQ